MAAVDGSGCGTCGRGAELNTIDRPFPLLKRFALYVLPLLIVGAVGLSLSLREMIATGIEAFQAEQDQANAKIVLRLVYGEDLQGPSDRSAGAAPAVSSEALRELEELGIACLSVMSREGEALLETGLADVDCRLPPLASFAEIGATGRPLLKENIVLPGYWTTLAALPGPPSSPELLAAVSRPSGKLEFAVGLLSLDRALLFGGVLLVASLLGLWLVYRAQRVIDAAFETQGQVRSRMQRLLSKSARRTALSGIPTAIRHDAVTMFADLRNFSGYAESADVEQTALLVDAFVSIVTDAVESEGGDVDKLLGDGVLAWFGGADAARHAVSAAVQCILGCRDLPRRPGFGLFRGEVLAAAVGRGERIDFTILGRSVNLASRLCSLSGENEISVPAGMIDAPAAGLELVETDLIRVKNHVAPIEVSRYRLRLPTT